MFTRKAHAGGQADGFVKTNESYTNFFHWVPFEMFEHGCTDKTYHGKPGNFKMRIALAQPGPVQFELIEPLAGENINSDFLETRGEGLDHFGLYTIGIEERTAAMQQMGIGVFQSGKRVGATWAYMDTESLVGISTEFIKQKGW